MNPFDNPDADFLVLVNDLGQHSLWPVFATVPAGWRTEFGPARRDVALEFVERNWTDIAPRPTATVGSA